MNWLLWRYHLDPNKAPNLRFPKTRARNYSPLHDLQFLNYFEDIAFKYPLVKKGLSMIRSLKDKVYFLENLFKSLKKTIYLPLSMLNVHIMDAHKALQSMDDHIDKVNSTPNILFSTSNSIVDNIEIHMQPSLLVKLYDKI